MTTTRGEALTLVTAGCMPAATQKTGTVSSLGLIVTGRKANGAQVKTVTLTGTGGTANITANGVVYLVTYTGASLANTAAAFVATHAAALLIAGIIVTNVGDTIVFTSAVAGTAITVSNAVNATVDLAGTVAATTPNQIITKFWEEVNEGDYIYNGAQGVGAGHEVRRVTAVYARETNSANQRFDIDSAFTVELPAGSSLYIVRPRYKKVRIVATGAAAAKLDNAELKTGDPNSVIWGSGLENSVVKPFTYDGTGGNDIKVTLEE